MFFRSHKWKDWAQRFQRKPMYIYLDFLELKRNNIGTFQGRRVLRYGNPYHKALLTLGLGFDIKAIRLIKHDNSVVDYFVRKPE